MPISSRARKREGSETMAKASRPRARSKPQAPTEMWGEDIVQSGWKRSAAQQAFVGNWKVTAKGCWEWSGGKSHDYGQLRVHDVWGSSPIYAHRLSFVLHKGPIPAGQDVCHECDNPPCCNPEHLFLGDQNANVQDMVAKDRCAFGERNGMAKLTERDIRKIRAMKAKGRKQYEIADLFGISEGHVSTILSGKRWRRSSGEITTRHGNAKLSAEQVNEMHALYEEGASCSAIGRWFDVTDATVRDAVLGNTWKPVYAARRMISDHA